MNRVRTTLLSLCGVVGEDKPLQEFEIAFLANQERLESPGTQQRL